MKKKPKILFLDIENLAHLIWAWNTWETDAIEVERPGHLLSMAYKWQGHKTQVIAQCDYKGYKPMSDDDSALCKDIWRLLNEADLIIGHNARGFDIKKINYRFMLHGLTPTSPYKIIDTLTSLKSIAKAPSHKLDALGEDMKIGRKLEHEGWALWKKCYLGDPKAWEKMKRYNIQDVILLEKWYNILRPWIGNHPNLNLYERKEHKCPVCLSSNYHKRGTEPRLKYDLERLQCKCGKWFYGDRINYEKSLQKTR